MIVILSKPVSMRAVALELSVKVRTPDVSVAVKVKVAVVPPFPTAVAWPLPDPKETLELLKSPPTMTLLVMLNNAMTSKETR